MSDTATPRTTVTDARGVALRIDEDAFLIDPAEIQVEISEIIECDLEGFLDLISERAGFPLLQEQRYEIDGAHSQETTLTLRVFGNVEAHLDDEDDAPTAD
jgi:hypothetical protein